MRVTQDRTNRCLFVRKNLLIKVERYVATPYIFISIDGTIALNADEKSINSIYEHIYMTFLGDDEKNNLVLNSKL